MQTTDAFRRTKASRDFPLPSWCKQTNRLSFCQANLDGDKCKGWSARLIFTHKLQPDHGFMLQGNQISPRVHLNTAVALSPSCLNAFKTKHRLCPPPPLLLIIYFFVWRSKPFIAHNFSYHLLGHLLQINST